MKNFVMFIMLFLLPFGSYSQANSDSLIFYDNLDSLQDKLWAFGSMPSREGNFFVQWDDESIKIRMLDSLQTPVVLLLESTGFATPVNKKTVYTHRGIDPATYKERQNILENYLRYFFKKLKEEE